MASRQDLKTPYAKLFERAVLKKLEEDKRKQEITLMKVREDIMTLLAAARNILLACRDNIEYVIIPRHTPAEQLTLIKEITFLAEPVIIRDLFTENKKPKKTFHDCLASIKTGNKIQISSQIAEHHDRLRKLLHKLYLSSDKKCADNINAELLTYTEIIRMKRLGKTKQAILIEKPELTYNRMKYLSNMNNFRMMNKEFVYISHMDDRLTIVVAPSNDIVCTSDNERDRTPKIVKLEGLTSHLPEKAVIVLDSRDLLDLRPLPNEYSRKLEMQEWLTDKQIPFDEQAHTAELYALVQKFKHKHKETNQIRDTLENSGFTFIGVPNHMPNLSFFHPVLKRLEQFPETCAAVQHMRTILGNVNALEDALIINEMKLMSDDLEVENKVEGIVKSVKSNELLGTSDVCLVKYDPYLAPPYIVA